MLEGDEAHHCASVMRRGAGDELMVFDGQGRWAKGRITQSSARRVEVEVSSSGQNEPPPVRLSLLQSVPKGGNMELIIEKAVELGVLDIHPVLTAHTVVKLKDAEIEKKRLKWQRLALEACKQCGQNWLPQVHPPVAFERCWRSLPPHELRLIAALQTDSASLKSVIARQPKKPATVLVAIGPEGDFSPAEYDLARSEGCQPITLGPIVLRVETAAMFCLSVLTHELLLSSDEKNQE